MTVISKISGDSNDGDRNKKPQEEKKSFAAVPYEVTEICLALVRRRHYPKLSRTCKDFRCIIRSSGLYEKRLSLGVTESVLYASVGFPPFENPSWYVLHRDHVSLRLRKIASLPSRLLGAVVTIGPMMYVIGGCVGGHPTSDVTLIDCRFHTSESLPSMKKSRSHAVAGVIDGKIYVIGGCRKSAINWVEMFDVKKKVWSEVNSALPYSHYKGQFVTCAVMEDKIYVLDPYSCLIFDPEVGKLVAWEDGGELRSLWQASSCVVDDRLYTIDPGCSLGSYVVVYDPKVKAWRPVHGVIRFLAFTSYYDSKMVNLDGKLLILVGNNPLFGFCYNYYMQEEIWCIEIALEKHEGGGIWGKVESMARVLTPLKWPSIELSRTVTV